MKSRLGKVFIVLVVVVSEKRSIFMNEKKIRDPIHFLFFFCYWFSSIFFLINNRMWIVSCVGVHHVPILCKWLQKKTQGQGQGQGLWLCQVFRLWFNLSLLLFDLSISHIINGKYGGEIKMKKEIIVC